MWICERPFTRLEFFNYTNRFVVLPCCQSWLKPIKSIPSIRDKEDIQKIWLGDLLTEMRNSVIKGSYNYCNTENCPYYKSYSKTENIVETKIKSSPKTLAYSIDMSCNLRCNTCRKSIIEEDPQGVNGLNMFLNCIDENTEIIEMNGSGEVLFSKHTLNLLRTYKRILNIKKLVLMSNGNLFDEKMWNSFSIDTLHILKTIMISVDAFSSDTYSKIRIGGNFEVLKDNISFISGLRKNNLIDTFGLCFVVQKNNIHELYDFYLWSLDLGVDFLRICEVDDWGRFSYGEYNSIRADRDSIKKQFDAIYKIKSNIDIITNV